MKNLFMACFLLLALTNISMADHTSSYGESLAVPGVDKTLCPLARAAAEKVKSDSNFEKSVKTEPISISK